MKKWFLITFMMGILTLTLTPLATHAAGGYWETWLYDNGTGRALKVNSDGVTLADLVLPGDAGATYSSTTAVSRDGRYIAYHTESPNAVLVKVFDSTVNALVYNGALPVGAYPNFNYDGTPFQFNPNNTALAFGYAYFTDGGWGWEIQVIDLTINAVDAVLNSNDPNVSNGPASPSAIGALVTPAVRRFENETIDFTLIASASEGSPSWPAFQWGFAQNTIVENIQYTDWAYDQNILGEVVMAHHDSGMPEAFSSFMGFAVANTIYAHDALSGYNVPVSPAVGIINISYAQATEIVAYQSGNFTDTNSTYNPIRFISRNGTPLGEVPMANLNAQQVTSMGNIIGGLITTFNTPVGTSLFRIYTREGSNPPQFMPAVVWNSPSGSLLRIMWVSDDTAVPVVAMPEWSSEGADYGSGGGIQPLDLDLSADIVATPMVLDLSGVVQPTPTPSLALDFSNVPVVVTPEFNLVLPNQLQVGGQALVQTTDGDVLNMRAGAGRNFAIVNELRSGTQVTLVSGPYQADGLVWWEIRTDQGVSGFSVEAVDGEITLIPAR